MGDSQLLTIPNKKLLVTGSRSIKQIEDVWAILEELWQRAGGHPSLLIHGGAVGVDTLAGRWAELQGIPVQVVHPKSKGKNAFIERDREMVDMADYVIAIWDGESSGTRLTRDYAQLQGKHAKTWIVSSYEQDYKKQFVS
jgi:phosphopentomutase